MKIVLAHNFYQQPGGEDQVFYKESALLAARGHIVIPLTAYNNAIYNMRRLQVAAATVWNSSACQELSKRIREEHPDVVHIHNTFPLLSPSVYDATYEAGVPLIQTLHNYRLFCLNALFLRGERVCQDCYHSAFAYKGVLRRCYRGSASASLVTALMLAFHKARRTWRTRVTRFIALSEFARQTFVRGGLPAEKVTVKPNFIDPDPGIGAGDGGFALFVGRLSAEKGLRVLREAWEKLSFPIPLKIVGDGPEAVFVEGWQKSNPTVEWLGRRANPEVVAIMKQACVVIIPSIWYEGLPVTLLESFAVGTPVIASDIGSLHDLVEHGRTGLLFRAGDSLDLASQMERAFRPGSEWLAMRKAARAEFEAKYTAGRNYQQLMDIYQQAIAEKR